MEAGDSKKDQKTEIAELKKYLTFSVQWRAARRNDRLNRLLTAGSVGSGGAA